MPIRIKILLALHLFALPIGAIVAAEYRLTLPDPVGIVVVSLALSDAGLLGLWGGMGKTRWWLRSGCIAVSMLCLAPAIFMADIGRFELDGLNLLVVALPAMVVICFLLLLRKRAGLLLTNSARTPEGPEDIQFSLTHMLAMMAIIAAALAIRTGLQQIGYNLHMLTLILYITLINFAALWGALGRSRTFLRLLIVVPAAFLLGLIFPILTSNRTREVAIGEENELWSAIFGFQAIITTATLLVFRSCGWRICREASSDRSVTIGDPISTANSESSCVYDG